MREFIIHATYKGRAFCLGTFTAKNPTEAIIAASKSEALNKAAREFKCSPKEFQFEASEDFL